jgi:hypothetical protein
MTGRERLLNRRPHTLIDFESMGMRFTASVSHYPDGRIAELFEALDRIMARAP